MIVLLAQVAALCVIAAIILLSAMYFPYPSPLIRRYLPARKRWPEAQVRTWLRDGGFQKSFLRYFYRDPDRVVPPDTGFVAPADGLVTSFEVRDGVRYLVIALSFWDMHVQRSPSSGTVLEVDALGDTYMDGEGRQFAFLKEKTCPVQKRIVLTTATGQIAVRLITSVAARRIEIWSKAGEPIERGQRIGRILLGSTVVLELPESADLTVQVGQRVWAGETIVAHAGSAS